MGSNASEVTKGSKDAKKRLRQVTPRKLDAHAVKIFADNAKGADGVVRVSLSNIADETDLEFLKKWPAIEHLQFDTELTMRMRDSIDGLEVEFLGLIVSDERLADQLSWVVRNSSIQRVFLQGDAVNIESIRKFR